MMKGHFYYLVLSITRPNIGTIKTIISRIILKRDNLISTLKVGKAYSLIKLRKGELCDFVLIGEEIANIILMI
jgi:hypothetical protein